jgi:hypothetical protein
MVALGIKLLPLAQAAVAVQGLRDKQPIQFQTLRAMVATVQRHLFPVVRSPTQAAALERDILELRHIPMALAAQAAVATLQLQAQQTPAAVVVALHLTQIMQALAVPASSSSNTTSALPRSSPSSHRRSGLHLLAR